MIALQIAITAVRRFAVMAAGRRFYAPAAPLTTDAFD